jgi:hypothetical protein
MRTVREWVSGHSWAIHTQARWIYTDVDGLARYARWATLRLRGAELGCLALSVYASIRMHRIDRIHPDMSLDFVPWNRSLIHTHRVRERRLPLCRVVMTSLEPFES